MARSTATRDRHRRIIRARKQPCAICLQPIDYSLPYLHPMEFVADHIIPFAKGGPDSLDNKQPAHRKCNRDKSDAIDYDPSIGVVVVKRARSY